METNYTKWLAEQTRWSQELDEKHKKSLMMYLILIPIGSVAALCALGLLAGGVDLAINNAKYGAIFGVVMDLFFLVIFLPAKPSRRYRKQISKHIEAALPSQSEREAFAAQMLGLDGEEAPQCISWHEKGIGEARVLVSRDYLLRTSGTGNISLTPLRLLEQISLDARTSTQTARGGDMKVKINTQYYTIGLQYQNVEKATGLKKFFETEPELIFESREIRDKVAQAIEKVRE